MKSLKELYEKPYSLLLQFQSADLITVSEEWTDDQEDTGDTGSWG